MNKPEARQVILYAAMNVKPCDVCPAKNNCKRTLLACYKNIRNAARVLDGGDE